MPVDIFATKGTEYLLVIVYFALLVAIVRYIAPRERRPATARVSARTPWFSLADGYFFHPGHTWAADGGSDTVSVGLDDFAAQLVGSPDAIELPAVGHRLRQGDRGWSLRAGERTLPMISPVEGEVVEINQAVQAEPKLAASDPYGAGWLIKVRPTDRKATLRNLLSGEVAGSWMRHTAERLRGLPLGGLGVVMTDGGEPARGFGRSLDAAEWEAVTREFFLTE